MEDVRTIKMVMDNGKYIEFWFEENQDRKDSQESCKSWMFDELLDDEDLYNDVLNNGVEGLMVKWKDGRPIKVWRDKPNSSSLCLDGIKGIKRLELRDGDVIVLTIDDNHFREFSPKMIKCFKDALKKSGHDNDVIVIRSFIDLLVFSKKKADELLRCDPE
jgi:hypothetical protein